MKTGDADRFLLVSRSGGILTRRSHTKPVSVPGFLPGFPHCLHFPNQGPRLKDHALDVRLDHSGDGYQGLGRRDLGICERKDLLRGDDHGLRQRKGLFHAGDHGLRQRKDLFHAGDHSLRQRKDLFRGGDHGLCQRKDLFNDRKDLIEG